MIPCSSAGQKLQKPMVYLSSLFFIDGMDSAILLYFKNYFNFTFIVLHVNGPKQSDWYGRPMITR